MAAATAAFFAHPVVERLTFGVLLFDAAGLGLFTVTGTLTALEHGEGGEPARTSSGWPQRSDQGCSASSVSRSVAMHETRQRSFALFMSRAVQSVKPPSPISTCPSSAAIRSARAV